MDHKGSECIKEASSSFDALFPTANSLGNIFRKRAFLSPFNDILEKIKTVGNLIRTVPATYCNEKFSKCIALEKILPAGFFFCQKMYFVKYPHFHLILQSCE